MDEDLRARAEKRALLAEEYARRPGAPDSARRDADDLRTFYEAALDRDDERALREIVEGATTPVHPRG